MSGTGPLGPRRAALIGAAVALALGAGLAATALWTRPVRRAVATYTELISLANRPDLEPGDRLDRARRLCSARYLRTHRLTPAGEGGIVGLPRNIHKNFQAWRQGPNVWICPTNRIGPVYQFVPEGKGWRFDGPVGVLRPRGEFVPSADFPDLAE
ncbi:MAG TPA: hypothetical protein VKP69_01060 [Isosphaeraceae bacterium]|nr:hypothetical protein [Isosphaeraceae bacterium]